MAFYDLKKEDRVELVEKISKEIFDELSAGKQEKIVIYFSDEDTYIRKTGYLAIGRIYKANQRLQPRVLKLLDRLAVSENEKVRQTAINAAGEIGMKDFDHVAKFMENGLYDKHHSVRNAVIGSIKKNGREKP